MYMNLFRQMMAAKFRISYAQVGEDVVISQVLKRTPKIYIDLGANHPAFGNNTYYFYLRGGRGVCVDPNIQFAPLYKKWRPDDTFICAAVSGAQTPTVPFVRSGGHTDWHVSSGGSGADTPSIAVPNMHINEVLSKVGPAQIDVLSVDIESSTAEALESLDFKRFRIALVCVEINESQDAKGRVVRCLEEQDFKIVALNPVNAIYANCDLCDVTPPDLPMRAAVRSRVAR